MRQAYARIFPDYELVALEPAHYIYTTRVCFNLQGYPKFYVITNGIRPLAIHIEEDLAKAWQGNSFLSKKEAFEAAANVFMYITDKGIVRNRASYTWPEPFAFNARPPTPPAPPTPQPGQPGYNPYAPPPPPLPPPNPGPTGSLTIVRLTWNGNCDPEPLSLERFSRMLASQTHIDLKVAPPIPMAKVAQSGASIALISGMGKFKAQPADIAALRVFVNGGGTLFIDAAGGDETFAATAPLALKDVVPGQTFAPLSVQHPIYNVQGLPDGAFLFDSRSKDPDKAKASVRFRRKTNLRLGVEHVNEPQLPALDAGRRREPANGRDLLPRGPHPRRSGGLLRLQHRRLRPRRWLCRLGVSPHAELRDLLHGRQGQRGPDKARRAA